MVGFLHAIGQNSTLDAINKSMALIEFDMQGIILTANENFCKTMGYELSEIKGKHHSLFVDPIDKNSPDYRAFWEKLRKGEFDRRQYKRIANGGREVWIEASYNPIFRGSNPIKVVKFASDITASKIKALDDEQIMAAIDRSQAIIEFNPDGIILKANENFCSTVGYALEEIVGQHHKMFCAATYVQSEKYTQFWENLRAGQILSDEFMRIGKGGQEIWIQATYNPILDDQGNVTKVVKVATDVTVRMNAIGEIADSLDKISHGDMTQRLLHPFPPSMEKLRSDFNSAIGKLSETLTSVLSGVTSIRSNTDAISTSANAFSKRIENQAAALEETAAALDEITVNVAGSATRTEEARTLTKAANQGAITSSEIVSNAVKAMGRIEEASKQISNIIGVIDEIAFQTNLLALNAGVEAARAGEAGRGFAVVAQEVRELAQRSATAAKEIKGLIVNSASEVSTGVQLVSETGQSLAEIDTIITKINEHMDAIATSSKEQSAGISEVNIAVNQMDRITQQNAAMAEESTAATSSLADEANGLSRLVSQFDLGSVKSKANHLRQVAPDISAPVLSRIA